MHLCVHFVSYYCKANPFAPFSVLCYNNKIIVFHAATNAKTYYLM